MKLFLNLLLLLLITTSAYSQKISYNFGKVSLEELNYEQAKEEEQADAVYLYKSAKIYGDILVYQFRIKILTEKGLDLANWKITYNWGQSEDVVYLFAESHTLEDGKKVVTKIDKKKVFIEDLGDDFRRKSFTIPDVKIGSIIEIKYRVEKNFNFYLPTFYFQEEYPVVKAKLLYQSHPHIKYAAILSGLYADDIEKKEGYYNDSDSPGRETESYIYTAKNLPSFKKETLVNNYGNYLTKMRFQAHSTINRGVLYKDWGEVAKEEKKQLLGIVTGQKTQEFLEGYQHILDKEISDLEKIKKITTELQKNYYINDYLRLKFNNTLIKKVFLEKKGSPSDINILAGTLFFYGQIKVEPIFLSTTDNGIIDTNYPYIAIFNHFVWKYTDENNKDYIIDIRNKFSPISIINYDLIGVKGLNFYDGNTNWYNFNKGIRTNKKEYISNISIVNKKIKGEINTKLSDYAAIFKRQEIDSEGIEVYKNKIKGDKKVDSVQVLSLKNIEKPLEINYNFEVDPITISDTEFAFNPFQNINSTKNYFKEKKRTLPIEFTTLINTAKKITITLPEGYVVKSIPENLNVSLENKISARVYYNVSGNKIQILSKIRFKNLYFEASQYEEIKNIFSALLSKENELISIIKE